MKNRGFTLIELLVVIAIIGILASVVLASLNNARDKGEDAATRQQLSSLRAEAELSYDDNSRDYDQVCEDTLNLYTDLVNATCRDGLNGYTVTAESSNAAVFFCVDALGASATTSAGVAAGDDNWVEATHQCANL